MHQTDNLKEKISLFLKLFFPILIYQFANFSATFIDTMMTGKYRTVDLAGVSMAGSLWNPFFTLLTGIVSALVPIIGQHLGQRHLHKVKDDFHQFIYIALMLSAVLWLIVHFGAIPALTHFNLEPSVVRVGQGYLSFISMGILPLLLFSVCRSFFDSLGLTKLSMYLMLLLLPFNSFFNYILIYGKLGLPQMGGAGAGLGTALAYWLLLLVVIAVMAVHPTIKSFQVWQWTAPNKQLMKQGFLLGLPIGLQIFAEVAIFATVSLFMAKFSTEIISAHQSAMNFTTLLYAFPLSISITMPIAISFEIGAGNYKAAREFAKIGRLTAMVFAVVTLTFLYFFRTQVAYLYGSGDSFIRVTTEFLIYAFFFQLADAFAAPIQGILRGYKDTTYPFVIGVSAYWAVALPVGWLLDLTTTLGPKAYWIGLISGLFSCGMLLRLRLAVIEKRYKAGNPLERVV
ncbi:MATE family efflux transporter [Streptococcus jiangjianxini]|uniref:MATE family efflux transporter n=1 Tax=Streptococcus jiangjianxini TaxID=3161189 RepID=UPI0032ECF773